MKRLGVTIGLEGGSLEDQVALCARASEAGYTDAWSAEVGGADGFAPLAALAVKSSELRLGTAIVPVFTRPPALLAMSAAGLQNLSGGRFVLGLGTSSDIIVGRWMGERFTRPLTRLRETVEVLREVLSGKKVTHEGATFALEDFRLQIDPGRPVPIYLAALGPQACRLAGGVADGVILFLKSPDGVRQALEWVGEGAREAGRDPAGLDCVIRLPVACDEDSAVLAGAMRRMVAQYAMVDVYNRSLAQQGFESEVGDLQALWRAGEREAATQKVTDAMLDELLIAGDRVACHEKLERFRAAGVKTPIVLPVSVAGDPTQRRQKIEDTVLAMAAP